MSDLDPLTHLPTLEDPSVTRLLPRRAPADGSSSLLDGELHVATSVSVVVPAGGPVVVEVLAAMDGWRPPQLRIEVLVAEDRNDPDRAALRDDLSRSGRSWRVIERPPGGRAGALVAAAETAENEFVLIGTGGHLPFDLVTRALSLMWSEGADAALVEGSSRTADRTPTTDATPADGPPVEAALVLAQWLGLRGPVEPGRLVVLRRWVARWLFHELTRAISAGDEVADRARLLGIGVLHLTPDARD